MDICTKDVLTISEDSPVNEAIHKMYENGHRDIVILFNDRKRFGLLSTVDLIKMRKEGLNFDDKISTIPYHKIEMISKSASVLDALGMIKSLSCPVCVVDEEDQLCGFITYHDIVSAIDPGMMLEQRMVGEFLMASEPKKASQESTLFDVITMMDQRLYDCVILTDDDRKSVGIITGHL
jgi:predicted transcriptional regulator